MGFFGHVLLPVATEADARTTCAALEPYLDDLERVTAVHVVEKAGGGIDKAPLEKRQADAADILAVVESSLGESVVVETRIDYGTNVVDTLFDAATESGAEAVAFHPRGGSRLVQLVTGDVSSHLVTDPAIPVVSLPSSGE